MLYIQLEQNWAIIFFKSCKVCKMQMCICIGCLYHLLLLKMAWTCTLEWYCLYQMVLKMVRCSSLCLFIWWENKLFVFHAKSNFYELNLLFYDKSTSSGNFQPFLSYIAQKNIMSIPRASGMSSLPNICSVIDVDMLSKEQLCMVYFTYNNFHESLFKWFCTLMGYFGVDCTTSGVILQDLCGIKSRHCVLSSPIYVLMYWGGCMYCDLVFYRDWNLVLYQD